MLCIREASVLDLDRVVDVHVQAFPEFFLTRLGPRFLRLLYQGFIEDKSGVMLVAEDGTTILGFAAGTTSPDRFFSRLRRYGLSFLAASSIALLRSPILVTKRLAGAVLYRGEAPSTLPAAALLSSIGVLPTAAGRGVGKALLAQFADRVRAAGCRHVYLTTDRDGNEAVNRFYESSGFALESTFVRSGNRRMNRYVLDLDHHMGFKA